MLRPLNTRPDKLGSLFYSMPIHLDERHRLHSVGSMPELISIEPLGDESHDSESVLRARQIVEVGGLCVKR
jgi:hypothetical protein